MSDSQGQMEPCLSLAVHRVGAHVVMKEWEINADASIGSISLDELSCGQDGAPLHLLCTPEGSDLFTAQMIMVRELLHSPLFKQEVNMY